MKYLILLSAFFIGSVSHAKDFKDYEFTESIQCENSSVDDLRKLGVSKDGKGCLTVYEKAGKTKEVAKSSNGTDYCAKVMNRIAENLAHAKFECS